MPGKELRDDLSKEEIEEERGRTAKTRKLSGKGGGGGNKVKAIRKKEVKTTAEQRAGTGVGRDWSVMRTVRLAVLIGRFTESYKDCRTDFTLPTVDFFFLLQRRCSAETSGEKFNSQRLHGRFGTSSCISIRSS